jgi:hypothetical protein
LNNTEYYRIFDELPQTATDKRKSPEFVVRQAAQAAGLDELKPWAEEKVAALRKRHRWYREDAVTAHRLLEAYYWDRLIKHHPVQGRLMYLMARLMRLRYPKVISSETDKVVIRSPWRTDCPLVKGCNENLERTRKFCDACFQYGFIMAPDEIAILEASGPTVTLELDSFRESPRDLCHYAIRSDTTIEG